MSTISISLTRQQRKLAEAVILHIFRGNYVDALRMITMTKQLENISLPPLQENILRCIVLRLQNDHGDNGQGKLQALSDDNVSSLHAKLPRKVAAQIYEQAISLSYENFFKKLQQWQRVEHTIIEHNIYIYEQCVKMRMAQQLIDMMTLPSGINFGLVLHYVAILVLSYFLVKWY